VLAVLVYFIVVYSMGSKYIGWYILWFVIIALFFVIVTLALRKTHHLHIHHYTIGMVLILLIGYQSVPAALIMGFCNGMMIEGGSRWGYDPVWIKNEGPKVEKIAVDNTIKERDDTQDNEKQSD